MSCRLRTDRARSRSRDKAHCDRRENPQSLDASSRTSVSAGVVRKRSESSLRSSGGSAGRPTGLRADLVDLVDLVDFRAAGLRFAALRACCRADRRVDLAVFVFFLDIVDSVLSAVFCFCSQFIS